jgi:hypothetical protein
VGELFLLMEYRKTKEKSEAGVLPENTINIQATTNNTNVGIIAEVREFACSICRSAESAKSPISI